MKKENKDVNSLINEIESTLAALQDIAKEHEHQGDKVKAYAMTLSALIVESTLTGWKASHDYE